MIGGGMGGVRGGCTLPDDATRFGEPPPHNCFLRDMLLESHFEVYNDAKFAHTRDNFGWTLGPKCGEQSVIRFAMYPISWTGTRVWKSAVLLLSVIFKQLTLNKLFYF